MPGGGTDGSTLLDGQQNLAIPPGRNRAKSSTCATKFDLTRAQEDLLVQILIKFKKLARGRRCCDYLNSENVCIRNHFSRRSKITLRPTSRKGRNESGA